MSVITTLTVDAAHPALAGHFPGAPVVPGVVLLDETLRALELANGGTGLHWTVSAAKFLKPVQPGETLTVESEPLANGALRFTVSSAGRLVASGVLRPAGTARIDTPPAVHPGPRTSDSHWAGARERGSAVLFAIMVFLSLALGRTVARGLLRGIAAYYFLFAPRARRFAREYLRRALGREPSAGDVYRQVFTFAATLLDRLYLAKGRCELFDITIEGEPLLRSIVEHGHGAFLLGAHLGSFQITGAIGRRQPGLRVAMAMYEDTASKLRALTTVANSANAPEIIPLGHLEAMLRIRDSLEAGSFVGMLADRTIGEAPAQRVSFLGKPALFPSGPMRVAAALRRPVFFMAGLYRGANRYHIVFRELADFSSVARGARETEVQQAVCRYVSLLEEYCRSDPYNWFNFYDFWHDDAGGVTGGRE
jgi:predicted LPLAT superfamily acyltransferase